MKSRTLLLLCLLSVLAAACKREVKPVFKAITDQQITGVQKKQAKYTANAVFTNTSDQTFIVDNLVADLIIDGKDAATLYYNQPREIKPNSEFKLLLSQSFDNSDIIREGEDGKFPQAVRVEVKGTLTLRDEADKKLEVSFSGSENVRIEVRKEMRQEKKEEKKTTRELKREERREAREQKKNKD